jgi:predicted Zn-dependent protease with MMP-like domain
MVDVEPGRFEEMVITALDELPEELGRRPVVAAVRAAGAPPHVTSRLS